MKRAFAQSTIPAYCGLVDDCVCSRTFTVSNGWPTQTTAIPPAVPAAMSLANPIARDCSPALYAAQGLLSQLGPACGESCCLHVAVALIARAAQDDIRPAGSIEALIVLLLYGVCAPRQLARRDIPRLGGARFAGGWCGVRGGGCYHRGGRGARPHAAGALLVTSALTCWSTSSASSLAQPG